MAEAPDRPRVADHRGQRLGPLVDEAPPEGLHARHVLDDPPKPPRIRLVLSRQEPVARALEDVQALDVPHDLGDDLHRTRAGTHDRDSPAAKVVAVVPARGVELVAGEVLAPGQAGNARLVELPGRQHDGVGLVAAPVGGLDRPAALRVAPRARRDLAVRLHEPVDAVVVRDLAQIAKDLVLRRAQARPVLALRERERVQVRRDVASGARVAVVVPGSAELRRGIENRQVVEAVALQLDRGADAAEAGADDDHRERAVGRHPRKVPGVAALGVGEVAGLGR